MKALIYIASSLLILGAVLTLVALSKNGSNQFLLPNPRLTPGATRTTNVHDVCSQKAQAFRHTDESLKKQVCREYGARDCPDPKKGEIDHLIPLTLGGADTLANLWWQPSPDYHAKDKLEVRLHELVCSGKMPLGEAQHGIAADWKTMYEKVMK